MEKVTITELEKATQRIRGTIFYHFSDKQKLFESVVEEVFLPLLDATVEITEVANQGTFEEFIKIYKSPEERAIEVIRERYHIPEAEQCYFNFLSQAYKYYPDFQKQYAQVFTKEMQAWKTAIDRNKLPMDCDSQILANIVMLFKTGLLYSKGNSNIPGIDYDNTLAKFYDHLMR